ncbi:MAG TPA: NVEALA domain-containing protein [Candidatus Bacteroides merdipullorum]|uniref:NVEALA domain-containing protein n=1 Tax=Candidatus Bacteroides merdipullorum TaxID=2838474 RepID=A0A9D2A3R8_9BACE|nr:NVEALA domain-containing protein [Candidatus Bacteroides merdipullorum]
MMERIRRFLLVGIVLAIMLTACFVWNRQRGSMSDLMLANVEALQCKGINNISTNPNIIS